MSDVENKSVADEVRDSHIEGLKVELVMLEERGSKRAEQVRAELKKLTQTRQSRPRGVAKETR